MKDYRHMISSHSRFDDAHYWRFVRNTNLPHGTFGKKTSPDTWVFAACCLILAAAMVIVNVWPL